MDQPRLSIDLGTTNTAAAVWDGTRAIPVKLSTLGDQMPSGVLARDEDRIAVGEVADNEWRMYPDRYEPNPKHLMGRSTTLLGDKDYRPEQLVAAIFEDVRVKARKRLGTSDDLSHVALTHPVRWRRHQLEQLEAAARIAGFRRIDLVAEPVAAASHYATGGHPGSHQSTAPNPTSGTIGVFDFGGGTCDVAVLRALGPDDDEGFEVIAHGGDDLGGEEFDHVLMRWALRQAFDADYASVAIQMEAPGLRPEWSAFRDAVRRAKHTLSIETQATVPVKLVGKSKLLILTRDEFNQLVEVHLDQLVGLTSQVMTRAGLAPEGPGTVANHRGGLYLTGGSSIVPVVQERIAEVLGVAPIRADDPKTVVAKGALAGTGRVRLAADDPVPPPNPDLPSLFAEEQQRLHDYDDARRPPGTGGTDDAHIQELRDEIDALRRQVAALLDGQDDPTEDAMATPRRVVTAVPREDADGPSDPPREGGELPRDRPRPPPVFPGPVPRDRRPELVVLGLLLAPLALLILRVGAAYIWGYPEALLAGLAWLAVGAGIGWGSIAALRRGFDRSSS